MDRREIAPGVYGLGSEQVNRYLIEDGGRFSAVDAGLPGFARNLDGDLALEAVEADLVLFGHGQPWRDGVRAAVASARRI